MSGGHQAAISEGLASWLYNAQPHTTVTVALCQWHQNHRKESSMPPFYLMLSTMLSTTSMLSMLVFFPTSASPGSFFPVSSSSDRNSLSALRGVPVELRDKILAFHRQLEAPDNFTIKTTARPNTKVAGLAEWTKEDEAVRAREEAEVRGELQTDLFRFSSKVAIPHTSHFGLKPTKQPSKENFVHFLKRQARLRERIRKEWKRFMKWRLQKRKRKRLKRKINRRLNNQLRKRYGYHKAKGKRSKEEVVSFRKRKKKLKKRIARRLRFKKLERRQELSRKKQSTATEVKVGRRKEEVEVKGENSSLRRAQLYRGEPLKSSPRKPRKLRQPQKSQRRKSRRRNRKLRPPRKRHNLPEAVPRS